jgi:hypothetical protein
MVEPRALELTNALTEESQDPPLEESADDSTSSALAPRDSEKIPELSDANAPSIPLVTETGEISEEAVMKLFVSLKSDETSNEDEDDEPLSLTEEATSEEPLSLTQVDTSEEPLSLTEEDTGEEPLSLTDRDSEDKMEHSALMAEKAPAKLDSYFDLEILMAEMEAEKLKALEDDSLASDLDLDGFSLEALDNALDNLADGPSGGVDPLELSDRYIEGPLEMEQERATFTSEEQQDEILSVALLPQEEEYNLSGQEENEDDYEEYEDDDYLEPADFLPVEFLLCTLEQRSFKKMGMDQNPFLN